MDILSQPLNVIILILLVLSITALLLMRFLRGSKNLPRVVRTNLPLLMRIMALLLLVSGIMTVGISYYGLRNKIYFDRNLPNPTARITLLVES